MLMVVVYSAGDGVDYGAVNTSLSACQQRTCLNIAIRDNDKPHATTSKSFFLELMLVVGEIDQQINLHPDSAQVIINDDESEYLWTFYL